MAGVETLNINSVRSGDDTLVTGDTNRVGLTIANIKDIVVTGDVDLNLDVALDQASFASIDASANTDGLIATAAGAAQGVTMIGSALGANTLTGGAGADAITGGAGIDIIAGLGGADVVVGGGGVDQITFLQETTVGDTLTGGAGADAFIQSVTTAATTIATIITDFDFGTGSTKVDDLELSDAFLTGLTGVTDVVDTGTSSTAGGVVVQVTADGQTVTDADLVVITNATYATTTALLAGLDTAGASTVTYSAETVADDGILYMYSDGTNAFIAIVVAAGTTTGSDDADIAINVVQFNGIDLAGLLNVDTTDYLTIA